MNKIVRKEQFSEKVFLFEIEAPLIAKSRKAGNFVIVRVGKKGERMPLTIAGRYGRLCWWRTRCGTDAAHHPGTEGCRQQSALRDGRSFEGSDYPRRQGS